MSWLFGVHSLWFNLDAEMRGLCLPQQLHVQGFIDSPWETYPLGEVNGGWTGVEVGENCGLYVT